jgi:large subunit ribosomal protein L30e
MADLNTDLRLAVDTGKVSLGSKETMQALADNRAKIVVVPGKGNAKNIADILHVCGVSDVKVIKFSGSALELGTICGKPYPVSGLAVLEPGNSGILTNSY